MYMTRIWFDLSLYIEVIKLDGYLIYGAYIKTAHVRRYIDQY